MNTYLVTYHATPEAMQKTQEMSPDEMQAGMAAWAAWFERCGEQLVDKGAVLSGGQSVTAAGSSPSSRGAMGYSIIQAEDDDAAEALLRAHPHLAWAEGCEIEMHPAMPMPA